MQRGRVTVGFRVKPVAGVIEHRHPQPGIVDTDVLGWPRRSVGANLIRLAAEGVSARTRSREKGLDSSTL